MKPKRGKSSYILLAGLMGLIVVAAWLTYQIYSSLTRTQITPEQAAAILPLEGRIQPEVLENLRARRKFSSLELSSLVLNLSEASPSTESAGGSFGLSQ